MTTGNPNKLKKSCSLLLLSFVVGSFCRPVNVPPIFSCKYNDDDDIGKAPRTINWILQNYTFFSDFWNPLLSQVVLGQFETKCNRNWESNIFQITNLLNITNTLRQSTTKDHKKVGRNNDKKRVWQKKEKKTRRAKSCQCITNPNSNLSYVAHLCLPHHRRKGPLIHKPTTMGAQLVRALFVYASISTVSGFFGGPHRLTRSSHAQRSSLSMAEEPNLLQEQMKEFADGFGGLFGKPVPAPEPVKSTPPPPVVKKVEEVIPDVVKIASSIETDEVKKETPVVAPVAEPVVVVKEPVVVAQPEEVIDEQPMAKKAAPPAPKAETPPPAPKVEAPPAPKVEKKDPPVFSNPSPSMVKKDEMGAVAVKDVPIKAASTDKKPDPKEEIVKAQQAVTKSFLSFGSSLNEVNLKQVEALAAKAVANTVTTKTSEESAKPPAAPAGGYFNFLGGGKPEVKSEPTPAPKAPVVKAPAPAPVEAPKPSGGFFSFLESKDDKVATPASTPKTAAPVVKVVPPPAPVAKAPVAPPAPAPRGGGFFSFLESDPTLAPVVAKTAAAKAPAVPKVSEKVVEEVTSSNQRQFSTPTIAQARSEASKGTSDTSPRSAAASSKSQAPASPRGGMFDFLKPVDNEDISAPVVKAAPVAAPKAPSPAPKVRLNRAHSII